jgi:hypothetical protein
MVTIDSTVSTIRSTIAGIVGTSGGPFSGPGQVYTAQLVIDEGARVPSGTELLRPGLRAEAVVRLSPETDTSAIRTVCVKLPDLYGSGRDQDLLMASSADGVPFHHLTLPAAEKDSRLYSSLWLYLAGVRPILFGARANETGDEFEFLVSEVIGRFRPVGAFHLGSPLQGGAQPRFSARNSGGNLRPLPPVVNYRTG